MRKDFQKGFTLIELLIVIAIIAILAAVVFVVLNPTQRFSQARNARRQSDVENIVAALKISQVDNNGSYPSAVSTLTNGKFYEIGTATTGCDAGCTTKTTEGSCVDLTAGLVTGGYLGSIPMEPTSGTASKTLYYLSKNATGTIEVGACTPELSTAISVIR
ncbi:MAG TPA: prepilin-type N-terminal cleavage/methylation domain-containing protein [Patescibacteria group bacterium]|nr:prepilin-type N-terminal cleavage/methylation domain-containing protein [Patescibacteria group bacterium]